MKKTYIISVVFLGLLFFAIPFMARAATFPKYEGYVNDFAEILSPEEENSIETLVTSFKAETTNEIVVVTVKSLEGLPVFDYSQELFTQWGIGKREKNNGILFLIAPQEREAFVNVGKGLEGALPDSLTSIILRNDVRPYFTENQYGDGIKSGVTAIMQATRGEYTAENSSAASQKPQLPFDVFFIIGFFIFTYLGSFLARSKSWWLGGVFGGASGVILGFLVWTGIWILVSGVLLGGLGLLFDFVVSRNYQDRLKKGKPTDFWHSGGGFWWGGGGFGGRGGGGFGGFGGGMSGGGGAGMKW